MKVGKKKIHKGISDSDELKYYLCVKCCLCKQEVATLAPTGISILFSFSFFIIISTMIGPRFTECVKSSLIF